jgi:hypothetical protein
VSIAAGGTPRQAETWGGGFTSEFPAAPFQGVGALLALGVWAVWLARLHLVHLVKAAWRSPREHDTDGGIAYRWVLLLLVASFSYLVLFFCAAGARSSIALMIVGLMVTYHLVWARVGAETGIRFTSITFPLTLDRLVQVPFGSTVLLKPEIMALYSTRWAYMGGNQMHFEVVGSNAIETLKVADSGRVAARPLAIALVAGFAFSLVVSAAVTLWGMYHYGFLNTGGATDAGGNGWIEAYLISTGDTIHRLITTPAKPDMPGLIAVGAGYTAGSVLLRWAY